MHDQAIATDNKTLNTEVLSEPWLSVLLTHILPPTKSDNEHFAGAKALGVVNYARSALSEHRHRVISQLFAYARTCLDRCAVSEHEQRFMACEEKQQKKILQALQCNDKRFRIFFDQLIVLALEGLLSHPRHGGNQDAMGWQWLGYRHQEPVVVGSDAQTEGATIDES